MSVTYETALRELYALAGRGIEPGLGRVRAALSPEALRLRVVHVAGTNGKGSVCRMIESGLPGVRTGLFTSPHLHRLTERIRVQGREIAPDELAARWSSLPATSDLTFFEAVTVMALEHFAAVGVELAILETGLGGRLDATNVFSAPIVTAITPISLDHQAWLGDDLRAIAREKAGILKPSCPAIVAEQEPAARRVIEQVARDIAAPLCWVQSGPCSALPGAHQRVNAGVALAGLDHLEAAGFAVDRDRAMTAVQWPGRLETIELGGTRFVLDGAHNVAACRALAAHLGEGSRTLIFGVMADKSWREMLDVLGPVASRRIYLAPRLSRAASPDLLASHAPGEVVEDVGGALRASTGANEVIVAGSLFLVADVRARLLGETADPPIAL